MRVLVVRQPFASLIAEGTKPIELRSWQTSYRGELLIVAAKTKPKGPLLVTPREMPLGRPLCVVDLVDIRQAVPTDKALACVAYEPGVENGEEIEEYSWCLERPRPVTLARGEVKGKQGIYPLPAGVELRYAA